MISLHNMLTIELIFLGNLTIFSVGIPLYKLFLGPFILILLTVVLIIIDLTINFTF